jgi:phage-related tail fiber protein
MKYDHSIPSARRAISQRRDISRRRVTATTPSTSFTSPTTTVVASTPTSSILRSTEAAVVSSYSENASIATVVPVTVRTATPYSTLLLCGSTGTTASSYSVSRSTLHAIRVSAITAIRVSSWCGTSTSPTCNNYPISIRCATYSDVRSPSPSSYTCPSVGGSPSTTIES